MKYKIYDALRKLVLFVQFKKREKHPPWVFFRLLNCTNDTKPRKAFHLYNKKTQNPSTSLVSFRIFTT